jgi:predicted phage terminase large subunit-like protein
MAYVDGKWLERNERAERINLIKTRMRKLVALIKAGKASDVHYDLLEQDKEEFKRLERIHACEVDVLRFFYEYFSEERNAGNPDNLVPYAGYDVKDAPDFHKKLSGILNTVSSVNTTARIAWAASRGHAKSAYLSNAFPIHQLVYRKRVMILVISETAGGSAKFIKWCSNQLKFNEKLRDDFGELLSPNKFKNEKDSEASFLTFTGAKMESTSLGMQIRGFRNGSTRPDLIILDDLESRASNNTPELRQKAKDWLNQDLLPAGDPTRTAVLFMGTIVHHDSLLNYVLNSSDRADFIRNRFPAVISHPERTELWDEFTRIYKEYEPTEAEMLQAEKGEIPDGTPQKHAAMEFYRNNKAEMDKGVQVLWGSRFPYHSLMLEKVAIGAKAFNTEFMNNPIDEESQIFKPDLFTYYPLDMQFNHKDFLFYMGVDFAMGKEKGDYSAIVTVARHKQTGKLYVYDAWGDRVHPDTFMNKIIDKVIEFQVDGIAVESQMAQEFFADRLRDELQNRGYPRRRVKNVNQRARKELRIEAMQPDIENGKIIFSKRHLLLLEHFERYGSGWHDDLPDALEMAISASKRAKVTMKDKPHYL